MDQINIYRSRKHLTLAVAGSMGFVLLGVFMLTRADISPVGYTIALVTTIFFGSCALAGGLLLFRKKDDPMVILSSKNLTLCNSCGSCHQIQWQQITGFEAREWHGEVFLLIHISKPDETVAAETNSAYRKILLFNNKLFGTPYCITPKALNYPKGALLLQLRRFHQQYRDR